MPASLGTRTAVGQSPTAQVSRCSRSGAAASAGPSRSKACSTQAIACGSITIVRCSAASAGHRSCSVMFVLCASAVRNADE